MLQSIKEKRSMAGLSTAASLISVPSAASIAPPAPSAVPTPAQSYASVVAGKS